MSTHITLSPAYSLSGDIIEKLAEEHGDEYSFERESNSHIVYIKGGWSRYRSSILKHIVSNGFVGAVLEMDRRGDCMDKNVSYTYMGSNVFKVDYLTDDINYKSLMTLKV